MVVSYVSLGSLPPRYSGGEGLGLRGGRRQQHVKAKQNFSRIAKPLTPGPSPRVQGEGSKRYFSADKIEESTVIYRILREVHS